VLSATSIAWIQWSFGEIAYYNAGTAANAITFTTPYACTDIDIVYLDANAGTWNYAVDGGGSTPVTNTGVGYHKRIQLTGLANTTHTIVCGTQSAANVLMIAGCITYKSRTSGIGFASTAVYGQTQDDAWGQLHGGPADKPSYLQGKGAAATGFGFPSQPSLAMLEYGINDCGNGVTVASFTDTLRRLIQALRRGQSRCSILLLGNCNPDAVNGDLTAGNFANSANWVQYLAAMQQTAAYFNCAFVNMHARWGETPLGQGFVNAGGAHPNNAGHADIASVLAGPL
jgi:hypothetical protein